MLDLVALTEEVLCKGGPLSARLRAEGRRFAPRAEQRDYARMIATALMRPGLPGQAGILPIEGGTGTGKTLGYLVPLALFASDPNRRGTKARCAVATHTLDLHRQVLRDAQVVADGVADLLGTKPLGVASRRGVHHFIDPDRVADLLSRLDQVGLGAHRGDMMRLRDFAEAARRGEIEGDISDFGPLPAGLQSHDVSCITGRPTAGLGHVEQHLERAKAAGLVVTTHMTLLLDARWNGRLLQSDDEAPLAAVVVDEADELPGVADSLSRVDLALSKLKNESRHLGSPALDARLDDLDQAFTGIYGTLSESRSLQRLHGGGYGLEATRLAEAQRQVLVDALAAVSATAKRVASRGTDSAVALGELSAAVGAAASGVANPKNAGVLRWSPVKAFPSIALSTGDAGRAVSRIWRGFGDDVPGLAGLTHLIATSATLGPPAAGLGQGGDFVTFLRRIDARADEVKSLEDLQCTIEPRKFGTCTEIVLADRNAPSPSIAGDEDEDDERDINPAWVQYVARAIDDIHAGGAKRSLVLTNSYLEASAIAAQMTTEALVVTRGTKLSEQRQAFAATPRGIMITPTGWAGLDLPGMLDAVIIARVPFAPPDHLAMARRRAWGGNPGAVYVINLHEALRRLRQGIGRLIRDDSDAGRIVILDPRFPASPAAIQRNIGLSNYGGRFRELARAIPRRFRKVYEAARFVPYVLVKPTGTSPSKTPNKEKAA